MEDTEVQQVAKPEAQQLCLTVQAFGRSLATLLSVLQSTPLQSATTPSSDEESGDEKSAFPDSIWRQSTQLQQQFQEILATIDNNDLEPAVEMQLRPLQTESHRRLRLLSIEAMRLRTAKQPATVEKTRSQLSAHVSQLLQFAQAMATEVCSSET